MTQQTPTQEANLPVISAADLINDYQSVQNTLKSACQRYGFFYLDYRDTVLEEAKELYGTAEDFFKLTEDEKLQYDVENQGPEKYNGYKIAGRSTGPLADKRDGFEAFTIPNNSLFSIVPGMNFRGPQCIQKDRPRIQRCVKRMHVIAIQILKALSAALALDPDEALESHHRADKPSTSALSLLRYLPETPGIDKAGHMSHTDIGTLSIVFSEVPGLQVQLPGESDWRFVPPKPGYAVVNVGDCLTFLTGGRLPSILHRVIPAPGEQDVKYTIGYFLRPEFDTRLTDREGRVWMSYDWHCNKFRVFRAPLEEQKKASYLTGKAGYLGLVE